MTAVVVLVLVDRLVDDGDDIAEARRLFVRFPAFCIEEELANATTVAVVAVAETEVVSLNDNSNHKRAR